VRIDFLTLFPEVVRSSLSASMMARACQMGAVEFGFANPRDYCYDRHRKVDDAPFGGEPGMLIRPEPVALALSATGATPGDGTAVILTAPTGQVFDQTLAQNLSKLDHLVFLCGHYEGFDHRVETQLATHVVSLGDFVLTNGAIAALVMADAIVRLLPGVLGSADSLASDSHSDGLLSAPNYTRPETWRGEDVPEVLLSGNHQAIARWRREVSLRLTQKHRPDLLSQAKLEKRDLKILLENEERE
jgi:tRNA (guanine37-N1)-methyltransferase